MSKVPHSDFNPRAPCGARRFAIYTSSTQMPFQSTRPLRGATSSTIVFPSRIYTFQSTRPLRGATTLHGDIVSPSQFQSTRPLRGATVKAAHSVAFFDISIHAPLAGRDLRTRKIAAFRSSFQSTRPLRGATAGIIAIAGIATHFNPRAPCGARRVSICFRRIRSKISIHAPLAGRDFGLPLSVVTGLLISIHAPLAGRDRKRSFS